MAVEIYEKVHEALKCVHPGSFFRITYKTEVPFSKKATKEMGVHVEELKLYKIVSTTVRTGVAYSKIRRVAEKLQEKAEEKKPVTNNWVWIDKNTCKFNRNTAKFYLCCATIPFGGNCKIEYVVVDSKGQRITMTKEEFENSWFYKCLNESDKKTKAPCEYFTVSYDNIFSINGKALA